MIALRDEREPADVTVDKGSLSRAIRKDMRKGISFNWLMVLSALFEVSLKTLSLTNIVCLFFLLTIDTRGL